MLDFSFENILHSNVINFLILIALIGWIISKLDIKTVIESKRKKIEDTVVNSESAKSDAHLALKDAEEQRQLIPKEIDAIKSSAESTLKSLEDKILNDAKDQIVHIEENVEKILESEKNKITSSLSKGVSKASVALAKENIKNALTKDIEMHNKFIAKSIEELDGVNF